MPVPSKPTVASPAGDTTGLAKATRPPANTPPSQPAAPTPAPSELTTPSPAGDTTGMAKATRPRPIHRHHCRRHLCLRYPSRRHHHLLGNNGYGQNDAPPGQYTAISAGNSHVCAIRADNTLACWGRNDSGQASPPTGQFYAFEQGLGLRAPSGPTTPSPAGARRAEPNLLHPMKSSPPSQPALTTGAPSGPTAPSPRSSAGATTTAVRPILL